MSVVVVVVNCFGHWWLLCSIQTTASGSRKWLHDQLMSKVFGKDTGAQHALSL